ncbi:hypothetical protein DFJ74DRAFT_668952 [Hyaloraphidium curvatum]|nr:hypothetical protein DFJ74DRAFT_668952 [Hyaloraphidium curvatum]
MGATRPARLHLRAEEDAADPGVGAQQCAVRRGKAADTPANHSSADKRSCLGPFRASELVCADSVREHSFCSFASQTGSIGLGSVVHGGLQSEPPESVQRGQLCSSSAPARARHGYVWRTLVFGALILGLLLQCSAATAAESSGADSARQDGGLRHFSQRSQKEGSTVVGQRCNREGTDQGCPPNQTCHSFLEDSGQFEVFDSRCVEWASWGKDWVHCWSARISDTWPYVLLPGEQQNKAYVQCEMRKVFRCPEGSKLVMRNGSPLCKEYWLET